MPRRPLPPRIDCPDCGKPTNQRGYAGPECQCDHIAGAGNMVEASHSIRTMTARD